MRTILTGFLAIILCALGYLGYVNLNQDTPEAELGGLAATAVNLIGSRTGTTTTYVSSDNDNAATTTYPFLVGQEVDQVTLKVNLANGKTGSNFRFQILSSNETECDTATSSTHLNMKESGKIVWFDAASSLRGLAGSATQAATTTFTMTATKGNSKDIVLENLNVRCLALAINASSTDIWVQAIKKIGN